MITRLVIAMVVRPTITNLERIMITTLVSVACGHVQYHVWIEYRAIGSSYDTSPQRASHVGWQSYDYQSRKKFVYRYQAGNCHHGKTLRYQSRKKIFRLLKYSYHHGDCQPGNHMITNLVAFVMRHDFAYSSRREPCTLHPVCEKKLGWVFILTAII